MEDTSVLLVTGLVITIVVVIIHSLGTQPR
jgi:hypothetical protein